MLNMEIDNHANCNYQRARDQNNNHGLLICSNDLQCNQNGPNNSINLMSGEQNLHQMNLNHHNHLSHCQATFNVCPSIHNQQLAHLHQQQDICSSDDSASPDDTYKYKLSPSQNEKIQTYKRETDNY